MVLRFSFKLHEKRVRDVKMPKKHAEKDKKPIQVYMSPEHLKELSLLKKALGVESDSEALRIAIRLAYEFLKQRGIIQD